MVDFGPMMKRLRGKRKQREIAELLSINQPRISKYEAGIVEPSLEIRMRVYKAFREDLRRLGYRRRDVLGEDAA
jgi:transcriptional regulator with XRE-family HTH domain